MFGSVNKLLNATADVQASNAESVETREMKETQPDCKAESIPGDCYRLGVTCI